MPHSYLRHSQIYTIPKEIDREDALLALHFRKAMLQMLAPQHNFDDTNLRTRQAEERWGATTYNFTEETEDDRIRYTVNLNNHSSGMDAHVIARGAYGYFKVVGHWLIAEEHETWHSNLTEGVNVEADDFVMADLARKFVERIHPMHLRLMETQTQPHPSVSCSTV